MFPLTPGEVPAEVGPSCLVVAIGLHIDHERVELPSLLRVVIGASARSSLFLQPRITNYRRRIAW